MFDVAWVLFLLAASGVAGAFGRRFAGGLLGQWTRSKAGGTQVGRAVFGLCMTIPGLLAGLPWWLALIVGMGFPIGLALRGNTPGMSMGREWGGVSWPLWRRDAFSLTLHGWSTTAIPAIALFLAGYPWIPVVAAGMTCFVIHEWAWRMPLNVPWLGCFADERTLDPPPTAELYWGYTLAVATFFCAYHTPEFPPPWVILALWLGST